MRRRNSDKATETKKEFQKKKFVRTSIYGFDFCPNNVLFRF